MPITHRIDRSGNISRYYGDPDILDRVDLENGDLLFHAADLYNIDELIEGLDLSAWADGWSFDLEGLDTRELIAFLLCTAVLFPLMDADEGITPGVPLSERALGGAEPFSVLLDGAYARQRIVQTFDCRTDSFDELLFAMKRRSLA